MLIDVENDDEWEEATEEALDRAGRGVDVEWNDVLAVPNRWTAMISESQELLELVELLTAKRDRPGGLKPGEQEWLDELLTRVALSPEEIERFNRRRKATED